MISTANITEDFGFREVTIKLDFLLTFNAWKRRAVTLLSDGVFITKKNMATIALEGMHFYAYHGFYEEEQIIGNRFLLDVYINANTSGAASMDDLFRTVNYETVYFICQSEMKKTSQLIETVAQRILNRISQQFEQVQGVKVRLRKLNPPLAGRVESAYIEVSSGRF